MHVLGGAIIAVAGVVIMALSIWGLVMLLRGDLLTRNRQGKDR